MEVVASLSQGRTAAALCDFFTHKSVPVIFEPRCKMSYESRTLKFGISLFYLPLAQVGRKSIHYYMLKPWSDTLSWCYSTHTLGVTSVQVLGCST